MSTGCRGVPGADVPFNEGDQVHTVRSQPVLVIGTLLNTLVIVFVTFVLPRFGIHPSALQVATVSTISTAVASLVTALLVRPMNVAVIHTAVVTILVAVAGFGLHLSAAEIAYLATGIVALLGYMAHEKLSPITV